ncbi:unnamed protein product [Effrenium voratum]|nr:unnamed protein product [Effrenium voratum]
MALPMETLAVEAWLEGARGAPYGWTSLVMLSIAGLLLFALKKKGQTVAESPKRKTLGIREELTETDYLDMGMPQELHLEGGFFPATELLHSNSSHAYSFHNERCSGLFLALHRPTFDKRLDASNNYAYGSYFAGKKRLWELRFQIQVRHPVRGKDLHFAFELEEFVPMNAAQKRTMEVLLAVMRRVIADRLYHSIGDDPAVVEGEAEVGLTAFPLWSFDHFLESEGTPPDLTDPNLHEVGHMRSGQLQEHKDLMDNVTLMPGKTYTLCFWGPSRFMDMINWTVIGVPVFTPCDFNLLVGLPPLHMVLYTLDDSEEKRHLQSRKKYFFRCAFWSSLKRPSANVVKRYAGASLDKLKEAENAHRRRESVATNGFSRLNVFQCCT